jgi:tetratricopeptide (TPR) repeat protein
MPPIDTMPAAAGAFQQIADAGKGERARRAAAGALVLRAVGMAAAGEPGSAFAVRRAHAEADALPRSAEASILRRLLATAELGADAPLLAPALVSYACELERTHRVPEAGAAACLARELAPVCAATALHAGRIARKAGDAARALELYREARRLDAGDGALARLAAVGEAVVSEDAERALGRAVRAALRAGDAETAAVGLEERARVRRSAGDRAGAVRDLAVAAARFGDAVDRARVAHELAGAALAAGDPLAAREALQAAEGWGDTGQRDHARTRLHTLARDLGDQLGTRRWRASKRPELVSLSAYRPRPAARSATDRLARGRHALARA